MGDMNIPICVNDEKELKGVYDRALEVRKELRKCNLKDVHRVIHGVTVSTRRNPKEWAKERVDIKKGSKIDYILANDRLAEEVYRATTYSQMAEKGIFPTTYQNCFRACCQQTPH